MNVAQLDTQRHWRGGEQQVLYLARHLPAYGCRPLILCQPHSALWQRAAALEVPAVALRARHELDVLAAWRLARLLRRQGIALLHMHDPHAHTLGLLAGLFLPRLRKVVSRRVDFPPARHRFNRWKYQRRDVQYLAVSEAVRQVLLASGVAPHQVQTVYSGVELPDATALPPPSLPFAPGTRLIGTVGHLAGHKGQRYLLEAFRLLASEVSDLGLVLVGDGELRPALQAQARALGIAERVWFAGFRQDVLALVRCLTVFAFPSVLEGLGTSLLDAMALGKPVVASRAGGIPEVVQDGVSGLLVPPADPPALAAALRYLLFHPQQAQRLGEAGRQRVARCFTAARMACETAQVYRRVLGHGTP
ncbi:MAG: glycosyl transferase [Candidatus Tectimicrobiota bacterium]|nr:MAG: glycosyl transferase [Candidatus Tectomicrobia bacterium]